MIGELYERAFAVCTAELVRLDAGVRSGTDPEAVHDARVALRRLRSYLRTFRPILDATWANALRERMRWLDERLAQARDVDVILAKFEEKQREHEVNALPPELMERLRAERDEGHASIRAALRHPQYLALLEEIVAAAKAPRLAEGAHEPVRRAMPKLLRAVFRRARKRVREYDLNRSDATLHEVRKAAKHVRYAAECFEELGGKSAKRLARRAERLQMLLGDHRDTIIAATRLRSLLGAAGPNGQATTPPRWRPVWKQMTDAYGRLVE